MMKDVDRSLPSYSLELETGDAGQARLLGGDAPLVFSPGLLALSSEAEIALVRYDEHLEDSPYRECMSLFQKRSEVFALAAICGSELPYAHFVAPESPWPRSEKDVKANARKYLHLVEKYHDARWADVMRLDRSVLSMMHADLMRPPEDVLATDAVEAPPISLITAGYPQVPYRDAPLKGALPPEELTRYANDLMAFCAKPAYLTQMQSCLAHLQFHYVSPFNALNAAVGTLLSYVIYARRGYSRNIAVSVAETTLGRVDDPVDGYKAVGEGAVNPYGLWVYHAAKSTLRQIERMEQVEARFARLREMWLERLSGRRCSPVCVQLATDLLSRPFVDGALIQHRYDRTAPAANGIIQTLTEQGILRPVNDNKRYRLFCAQDVLDVYYDAFDLTLPKGWLSSDSKKLDFE